MVAVARSRGAALGLTNAEYQVLDEECIVLDSESVDCVLCRWGYMLMENPALALRETRRVLRPGGRLALSVWGEPVDNVWASAPAAVLVNGGWLEPPSPAAPGIFALAAPERLRHVLADAGFSDLQLDQIDVVWSFASFDAYWHYLCGVAGAIAIVLEGLGGADHLAAQDQIRDAVEPDRAGDGYRLPGRCLNASARRDSS